MPPCIINEIKSYIPEYEPPPPSELHDETRWTYSATEDYKPLTTILWESQQAPYCRFLRYLNLLSRLVKTTSSLSFGSRRSPRRSTSLRSNITLTELAQLFQEYPTYEALERDIAYGNRDMNRWQPHLSQLVTIRKLITTMLHAAEQFVKAYGYRDGLRTYVTYHGINVRQTHFLPHPLLFPFEVQYLISLRRFLFDYYRLKDSFRIEALLSATFQEPEDLARISQIVIKRLACPDYRLGLEETT